MGYFIKIYLFVFILCSAVLKVNAQSVGGTTSGGRIYCDTLSSGFLSLSGENGTILYWESSTDSVLWTSTGNSINVQSYYHLQQTTWYRAIVQDGVFSPDTSTVSRLTIYPTAVGGTITGGGIFCGGSGAGTLNLTGNTGAVLNWQYSTDNGNSWTVDPSTSTTLNYTNITQNTLYEAVVQTNTACPLDSSSQASFVFSPSIGGVLSGGGTYCVTSGSGTLTLTGELGTILNWQYSTDGGTLWTPVSNTSNQLNYSNITQNTLYEAVVQLGSCPPDTSSQVSFIFDPTVPGTVSAADSVCYGLNSGTLLLTGNVGDVVRWQSSVDNGNSWVPISNTTTSLTYSNLTQTTLYQAIVQNDTCSGSLSNSVEITVLPLPVVNAGVDTSIYQGDSLQLSGAGAGIPLWTPAASLDSADIFTPLAIPGSSTLYILTVTDTNSCVNQDSVFITVNSVAVEQFPGVVSNLFTPNGDGINDTWYIQDIQNYSDNEVFIYNIYGDVVFTKKGYMNDWQGTYNGSALPDGTYYYVIRFDNTGEIFKGALDIFKNK